MHQAVKKSTLINFMRLLGLAKQLTLPFRLPSSKAMSFAGASPRSTIDFDSTSY
jgi:hypothetical protein